MVRQLSVPRNIPTTNAKMKFILLACFVAFVAAAPQGQPDYRNIKVVSDDRDVRPDGYSFQYQTDDGVKRSEEGTPTKTETRALAQTGRIEYVLPDGQLFVLTYVADENGYRPESSFIPTLGKK